MFSDEELARERQQIVDWYNTTCSSEYERTILDFLNTRLEELRDLSLEPLLHKRPEYEGISYERARGTIEGEAQALQKMLKWRPEAGVAMDEMKNQDILENDRNAQMPVSGAVRDSDSCDTSWAERRAQL